MDDSSPPYHTFAALRAAAGETMTKKELWAVAAAVILYVVGWLGFVQWDRATDCPPWTADDAVNTTIAGMLWPLVWPVQLIHVTVKTCDVEPTEAQRLAKD